MALKTARPRMRPRQRTRIKTRPGIRRRPQKISIRRRRSRPFSSRPGTLSRRRVPRRRVPRRSMPRRRPHHRRPPRWLLPWWRSHRRPVVVRIRDERRGLAALRQFSPGARVALARAGMDNDLWIDRLAGADDQLVDFINRFYRTSGFHYVVRSVYGSRYQRRLARLAMRLARRLASRRARFVPRARFVRTSAVAPDGEPVDGVSVVFDSVTYLLNPWPYLDNHAVSRLLARSAAVSARPSGVRWVFDGGRLDMSRRQVIRRLRRRMDRSHRLDRQTIERWQRVLPMLVRVI